MACYHPVTAYRSRAGRDKKTGSWPIVFKIRDGYHDMPVTVPCGQCIGCRLERSRQWAIRCVLESKMYNNNCFITLTYNDKNLKSSSLNKRDYQLFMKRLRKEISHQLTLNKTKRSISASTDSVRYYACGEYGDQFQRPHYHACLFGIDFKDKQVYSYRDGIALCQSQTLQKLWPFGYSTIGDVTFESAAYVARYIVKKINGEMAKDHYKGRLPEFTLMSRKPGIARDWFELYQNDITSTDRIIVRNNLQIKPPKYYDNILKTINEPLLRRIKHDRIENLNLEDNTWQRLKTKEELQHIKAEKLKRSYDKWQVKKFIA